MTARVIVVITLCILPCPAANHPTSQEDLARQSGNFFGKLRSNFVGTEFTIFDRGVKPGESAADGGLSQLAPRTELGAVTYEYNVLGTRGPRKMTTIIPSVDGNGQRAVFRPVNKVRRKHTHTHNTCKHVILSTSCK